MIRKIVRWKDVACLSVDYIKIGLTYSIKDKMIHCRSRQHDMNLDSP